jgi:hypothetical protein
MTIETRNKLEPPSAVELGDPGSKFETTNRNYRKPQHGYRNHKHVAISEISPKR